MILTAQETENLRYFLTKDEKGKAYYQIWEKDNNELPIALFDGKRWLQLQDRFPKVEKEYRYFDEFCKVIQDITDMKQQGWF